ncbi:MAG: phospholipase [Deltaproteobacteria bacterium]|nr:phospholipase [Deltaproteobacteria bacterium]MBW2120869.1 phospholipase [Deltaproteobacteria bacterium]
MRILVSLCLALVLLLPAAGLPGHSREKAAVRLLEDTRFFPVLADHIEKATREIVVSMFLFKTKPGPPNRANSILEDLIIARKRGVRVSVLLERTARDKDSLNRVNLVTSRRLRQHGIHVVLDSPERTTHTKTIVIDRRFVFIGSHNLTQSALSYNHELSVLIDDPALAEEVIRYVKRITAECPN